MSDTSKIKGKRYTFQGEELLLSEVAKRLGVNDQLLRDRMARGQTFEQAIKRKAMTASAAATIGSRASAWREENRRSLFGAKKL